MKIIRCGIFFVFVLTLCAAAEAQDLPSPTDTLAAKPDSSSKPPSFEVISIKENKQDTGAHRMAVLRDGYSATNVSLITLIANAYGLKTDMISGGPNWIRSAGFDLDAKVSEEDMAIIKRLSPTQRRSMLQPILSERFHLKVHQETKILPIYQLTVAKGGTKLVDIDLAPTSAVDSSSPDVTKRPGYMSMPPEEFIGTALTLPIFASQLGSYLHRPVEDKTGLTGRYDFHLTWNREEDPPVSPLSDDEPEDRPGIFTALKNQVGLSLHPAKGSVDTLVIDHVEMLTPN
jgi:uncharacterized protein (TIGR03435 family)